MKTISTLSIACWYRRRDAHGSMSKGTCERRKFREAGAGTWINELMGIRPTLPQRLPQRLRWQEFRVVLASARIGRFGELPTQENGPGVFFDCPSPRYAAKYFLERRSGTQGFRACFTNPDTSSAAQISLRQIFAAARGHALLPQHLNSPRRRPAPAIDRTDLACTPKAAQIGRSV